jgi:cytoskeletal protein CcmA (bactofilin family)
LEDIVEERRAAAWIGPSIVIKGDVISSEDTTIAGRVEGNVTVTEHTLTLTSRASIQGDIVARTVNVEGKVSGSITAAAKVLVGETGSIEGPIKTPRMIVSEGGALNGPVEMSPPK